MGQNTPDTPTPDTPTPDTPQTEQPATEGPAAKGGKKPSWLKRKVQGWAQDTLSNADSEKKAKELENEKDPNMYFAKAIMQVMEVMYASALDKLLSPKKDDKKKDEKKEQKKEEQEQTDKQKKDAQQTVQDDQTKQAQAKQQQAIEKEKPVVEGTVEAVEDAPSNPQQDATPKDPTQKVDSPPPQMEQVSDTSVSPTDKQAVQDSVGQDKGSVSTQPSPQSTPDLEVTTPSITNP